MGMLIKQGKGYTDAALAWRKVEVADPRNPDRWMNERRTRMPILCTQSSEYTLLGAAGGRPLLTLSPFVNGSTAAKTRAGARRRTSPPAPS